MNIATTQYNHSDLLIIRFCLYVLNHCIKFHHTLNLELKIPFNTNPYYCTMIPNFSSAFLFCTHFALRNNWLLIKAPIQYGSPNLQSTFSTEQRCKIVTPKHFIVSRIVWFKKINPLPICSSNIYYSFLKRIDPSIERSGSYSYWIKNI